MAEIELDEDERTLGTWVINYRPPGGGRVTGDLEVTDRRLVFDARFSAAMLAAQRDLMITTGRRPQLCIPKSRITSAAMAKKFLSKRVVVGLDDGQEHVFDYGLFPVRKLHAAISEGLEC